MTLITMGLGKNQSLLTYGLAQRLSLLYYHARECVTLPVPDDYKQAREYIFNKGGFLKDHAPIKMAELIEGRKRIKAYITPQETFTDEIIDVFPRNERYYHSFALKNIALTLITNAFQELSKGNTEEAQQLIQQCQNEINEYIKKRKQPNRDAEVKIKLDTDNACYEVEVNVY